MKASHVCGFYAEFHLIDWCVVDNGKNSCNLFLFLTVWIGFLSIWSYQNACFTLEMYIIEIPVLPGLPCKTYGARKVHQHICHDRPTVHKALYEVKQPSKTVQSICYFQCTKFCTKRSKCKVTSKQQINLCTIESKVFWIWTNTGKKGETDACCLSHVFKVCGNFFFPPLVSRVLQKFVSLLPFLNVAPNSRSWFTNF